MADQRAVDGALAQGVSAIESTYNSASVQFTQLMQQWQDNAAKVNQALQELADNLSSADKAMQSNEAETESSFSQILGAL